MTNNHHDPVVNDIASPAAINQSLQQIDKAISELVDGTLSFPAPDINGGTVDGATIGANSPEAGTFSDVTVSGTLDFGGVFWATFVATSILTVTDDTETDLVFDNLLFDTNDNYDTDTGFYTPSIGGYYLIGANAGWSHAADNKPAAIRLYKNNVLVAENQTVSADTVSADVTHNLLTIQYANGIDDFFEIRVYHNMGVGSSLKRTNEQTFFFGGRFA